MTLDINAHLQVILNDMLATMHFSNCYCPYSSPSLYAKYEVVYILGTPCALVSMWCLAELSSHWTYALRCMQTDMLGDCCELVFLGHCIWSSQPDVVLSSPLLHLPPQDFRLQSGHTMAATAGAPGLGARMSLDLGQTMNMRNFKDLGQVRLCMTLLQHVCPSPIPQ